MFLKKEKESRVNGVNRPLNNCALSCPRIEQVKQKLKCSIYTPNALWPLSPPITST